VLAIVAIVLLSPNHLHGVRRVSIILIISGVTVMIFAFVFNKVISDSIIPNVKLDNKPMQKDTQAIITSFTKNIDNKYWHFGEGYLALGAIVLAGTIYLSKRVKPHTTEAIDQKHTHQPLAKDS
jgi:vacuolar-type H+-ATPase subunit I/STV1